MVKSAAKRRARVDLYLRDFRRDYLETRHPESLLNAVKLCELWNLKDRKWMCEALHKLAHDVLPGRKQKKGKGRPPGSPMDGLLGQTVEDYRHFERMSLEKAFFAAENESKTWIWRPFKDGPGIPAATIRHAWRRWRKKPVVDIRIHKSFESLPIPPPPSPRKRAKN